ncbi:MAG: hypothetical protein HFG61_10815 [Lachnospiraceae bacterium]|nr:hypothetical protein [Lachnospiraceae bacterium]
MENADWIYMPLSGQDRELESILGKVEDALGFKLFIWQKTYIAQGHFRQYGATTAQVLKDLLQVDAPPLDYSKRTGNHIQELYRDELREIKRKLNQAGIQTRGVFFSVKEKNDFMENRRLKGFTVLPHEKERSMGIRYGERNSFNPGKPF